VLDSSPTERRTCRVCDAPLERGYRYCPSCGTAASLSPTVDDPSTAETRQFSTTVSQQSESVDIPPGERVTISPRDQSEFHVSQPSRDVSGATVPPENGNRTLWVILGIVGFIILLCCCLLPLALMIIANADTSFQDEIRSMSTTLTG
jgi:hypothetical protein